MHPFSDRHRLELTIQCTCFKFIHQMEDMTQDSSEGLDKDMPCLLRNLFLTFRILVARIHMNKLKHGHLGGD